MRPDISLSVPSLEAANPLIDGADGATFSPHIAMHVDPASQVHAAPTEPLLSSLLSKDQNVELVPPVSEAQGGHSREDDVDDWDYELDVTDIPILNPNWDPSMENPEDLDFSIPLDDLMTMMEEPLPTSDQGALKATTAIVEPTATEAPPLPSTEGEHPAPFQPPLDLSVPHDEMGIPVEPLPQPSDPVVTGQGVLLPTPDPSEANNNGDDLSVPVPPALDLLAVIAEAEIPTAPFECLPENSGATSPLNASEPNSSETQIISGEHSEGTKPLSGDTQQFSAAFETADDFEEVSSYPSLVVSGLERSSQVLEVLEARLDALRSEVAGLTDQIFVARARHTSLLARQREGSARASLLHMLASHLDRSVAEDVRHSIALTIGLSSLEVERSRARAAITTLEADADYLRDGAPRA
ncbi:hypothetical protein Taro_001672 [Colocasia esculenta]|uniref:Uncharacterized protein n=1 Tax=Colocasia esculenta TaxID=4460 RepID=A0A843TLF8_COLES|nr:hypothetical protein [Colocasia esculenta]